MVVIVHDRHEGTHAWWSAQCVVKHPVCRHACDVAAGIDADADADADAVAFAVATGLAQCAI
ncbi:hypothetical protein QSH33_014770 [Xanthomonas arboricola pv. pruni]|uniref:hypothetical protein n=1 Tax=Xanthomonas arboricola TaxID=56448 RepID=UPI000461D294|nr:hypothetical protein DK27_19095 [Xanthomonas arboricola pv. pruni]